MPSRHDSGDPGRIGPWLSVRRRREWRRALHVGAAIVAAVVGAMAATAGCAWIYARTDGGQVRLAGLVNRALHDSLPGARVGHLGTTGRAGGELIARDVDVWDPQGVRAIHVDRVVVQPRWRALLSRRLELDSLRVQGFAIDARTVPTGVDGEEQLNLAQLLTPSPLPGRPSSPWSLRGWRIDRIEVVDGATTYRTLQAPLPVAATFGFVASAAGQGTNTSAEIGELHARVTGVPGRGPLDVVLAADMRAMTSTAGTVDVHVTKLTVGGLSPGGQNVAAGPTFDLGDVSPEKTTTGRGRVANLEGVIDAGAAGHLSWRRSVTPGEAGPGDFRVAARLDDVSVAAILGWRWASTSRSVSTSATPTSSEPTRRRTPTRRRPNTI